MKRTKLGFLNYYILQWFFVRLTKHIETFIEDYEVFSFDVMSDTDAISARGTGTKIEKQRWSIQYWVYPLSGYGDKPYKYINGQKFKYLTDYKKIN
jgi:hypothetical protein